MKITLINYNYEIPNTAYDELFIIYSSWDDYGFKTTYSIYYVDEVRNQEYLGQIRIGKKNQITGNTPLLNIGTYKILPSDFFSLGRHQYYDKLNKLSNSKARLSILTTLRDIALNDKLFELYYNETVTQSSLLRDISITEVKGQLRRMANGGSFLTIYNFEFSPKIITDFNKHFKFKIDVEPDSIPQTNIHVITGSNGSGKTTLFNNIVSTILLENDSFSISLISETLDTFKHEHYFPVLINISFSVFENSNQKIEDINKKYFKYHYVGVRKKLKSDNNVKSFDEIAEEFYNSLCNCYLTDKVKRWQDSIKLLESDSMFRDINITSIIEPNINLSKLEDKIIFLKKNASEVFNKLSSGHKIILFTITRLVDLVEEKTLVLIDEPETHLHPPLLSAFMRSLSELLIHRNGVCIIATHSPVVLQEVPRSCVWNISRNGESIKSERLSIETYGENVGTLTQEVFGLEVNDSGFIKRLNEVANISINYEDALNRFNNQLGLEGKAILQGLMYQKRLNNDKT